MKKFLKLLFILSVIPLANLFTSTVLADSKEVSTNFTTMKVGEVVSEDIINEDGQKGTIVITKVSEDTGPTFRSFLHVSNQQAGNGTYHINYVRGVFNCGFYVRIDTRNITSAYGLWYFHIPGVNSADLRHESNRQATAYFQFQASIPFVNGPSWNGALRARLDADQLVTLVQ